MPEFIVFPDGVIGFGEEPSPEEIAKRRSISAKCGHVKRALLRNKRLTGKTLEFALTVVGEDSEVGQKLKAGKTLTDYELHLMIDVWLVHRRTE
jgi:hypothetical protein